MSKILACIDGSVYSESVADHAGWAAGRLGLPVELPPPEDEGLLGPQQPHVEAVDRERPHAEKIVQVENNGATVL